MGLPGKPDGISGADVEKFYLDGAHSRIADYCESDVVNTYRVWLASYELFRGRWFTPAVGFNRVSASWHSIFPIEAALTTRHGGPCGFGDMMAPMEAAFFVNEDALRRIEPGVGGDEAGFLGAFPICPVNRSGAPGRAICTMSYGP